jgi:hypothetical protein
MFMDEPIQSTTPCTSALGDMISGAMNDQDRPYPTGALSR